MMKTRLFYIAAAAIATALLILGFQAIRGDRGGSVIPEAGAQTVTDGRIYTLTQDSFIVTSSDDGRNVYLYYLDIKPDEEQSKITFITVGQAK